MKTLLLLLLLSFCESGQTQCQNDCLSCNELIQQVNFNTMLCLLECEGRGPSSSWWDMCRRLLLSGSLLDVHRRAQEVLFPQDDLLDSDLPHGFHHAGLDHLSQTSTYDSGDALSFQKEYQEETGEEEEEDTGLSVSKRFGGFVKGRHGYRKFLSPGRSYQKRYGGFIGIRKSARKWNNQKRFSEFLKQYLSARVSEDLPEQNQV